MIRSAGGVAALVTDNTHSALMLPQSAASPDLDTSLATATTSLATVATAAVSEAEVSISASKSCIRIASEGL